jgi:hypothetical protein
MVSDQSAALLHHVVARVREDVQLLVDLGHVDGHAAQSFLGSLPNSQAVTAMSMPVPAHTPTSTVAPPTFSPPVPAPKPVKAQARALWAYNENGTVRSLLYIRRSDMLRIKAI